MKMSSHVRLWIAVGTIIYLLIPLIVTIFASFTQANYPSFPPKGFSLQWYTKLLDRPEFMAAFITSIKIAVLTALVSVILGTLGALAISRYDLPGKAYLVSFLTAPLTVPQLVLGVALLIYFVPLTLAGTVAGLLLAHVVISIPYIMRLILTGLSGFDYASLERAAAILGANPMRVFWRITLPLIRPAMLSGALFTFLTSFDNVTVSLFLNSSDLRTLPIELFSRMHDNNDPLTASVSSLVIIISVAAIAIMEKIYGIGRLIGGNSH